MPRSTKKAHRAATKRQTRLTFTPVAASSSPGIERSPGTADDKLANVRYLGANSSPLSTKRSRHPPVPSSSPVSKSPKTVTVVIPSSDEDEIRPPRSTRRVVEKPAIKPTFDEDGADSADSADFAPSSPMKRRRQSGAPPLPVKPVEGEDDSDSDDIVRSSPVKRNRKGQPAPKIESADEEAASDSEDIIVTSPAKRRRKGTASATNSLPRNERELEDSDLAEDLADLQDSDTPVTETRTRGRAAESAAKLKRREQLEALRRRRAGGKPLRKSTSPLEEGSGDSESEGIGSQDSSSDEELVVEKKDSDVESVVPEDLDEYEDDFVLQDDDSTLGVPAELVDVPFEFSRHRYKKLRDHFKDVVEWMVHNKLNPAFPRDDKVYQVAFIKVKDELTGVTGSQLMSSVWNVDFRRALEARPEINISSFPVSAGHPCDACNRSKHPASYDIKFDGRPYMEENLEPVSDEDDSDEDGDGDSEESDRADAGNVDRRGNTIPDASKHFYLGRHCKTKAELAHTLMHWKYHLNEWVIDYLRIKGILADEKILEREHWSVKKRTRYANETVDMMGTRGEINRLWKDFNLNIKTAKGLKESRW